MIEQIHISVFNLNNSSKLKILKLISSSGILHKVNKIIKQNK